MKGPLNAPPAVGRMGCVARIAAIESMTYNSGLKLGVSFFFSSSFFFSPACMVIEIAFVIEFLAPEL